jgi:hypothetical protein
MFNSRMSKLFIVLIVVLVFATATYAFAATNTVPPTTAGEGAGAISGYTVSAIAYNLNATTPSNIDTVTFTLSAAATTVKASLTGAAGTFYNCTVVSGNNWSCNTAGATVGPATNLDIIAKDN